MHEKIKPYIVVVASVVLSFIASNLEFWRDRSYSKADEIELKLETKAPYSYVDTEIKKHAENTQQEVNRRLECIEQKQDKIYDYLLNNR